MAERDLTGTFSERRQSDRKKLIIDVNFKNDNATGIANTKDIGLGGLYMTTTAKLDPATLVFLRMTVGGKEIAVTGMVVYTDLEQGIGVRFHNLSDENKSLLTSELA